MKSINPKGVGGTIAAMLLVPMAAIAPAAMADEAVASESDEIRAVQQSVAAFPGHHAADPLLYKVMLDRLERDFSDQGDYSYLEAQGWVGSSLRRLWVKGEATHRAGNTSDASLEAYYSQAVSAYWDLQLGERHDFADNEAPSRDWLALGLQGLAPYKFETSVTAYLGGAGRSALRLTGEYDFFITQRLILWPELELNLYGKDDPLRKVGAGLANGRLALRLRYEIRRELAPYVGVQWTRKFGATADYASRDNQTVHDMQVVAGVRLWW